MHKGVESSAMRLWLHEFGSCLFSDMTGGKVAEEGKQRIGSDCDLLGDARPRH